MVRVGLTGGVASGKSTVSAMLHELGAVVIDADVLGDDGGLDRPALGAIVFADPSRRAALEAIVHPLVRSRAAEIEESAPAGVLVVHDIPLLVETGQAGAFDAVVVVDVPEELQVERAISERGWSQDEARSRIAAQATRAQRLAAATHVVENAGTIEDLHQRVAEVFGELVATS
jgi:dephospho-CoA kinase